MKGILLDDSGDILVVTKTGSDGLITGLVVDDTMLQDAYIVLSLNQGELKESPLIGPNLLRFTRGKADKAKIIKQIRIHLERVNIDYDELKDCIKLNLRTMKK